MDPGFRVGPIIGNLIDNWKQATPDALNAAEWQEHADYPTASSTWRCLGRFQRPRATAAPSLLAA